MDFHHKSTKLDFATNGSFGRQRNKTEQRFILKFIRTQVQLLFWYYFYELIKTNSTKFQILLVMTSGNENWENEINVTHNDISVQISKAGCLEIDGMKNIISERDRTETISQIAVSEEVFISNDEKESISKLINLKQSPGNTYFDDKYPTRQFNLSESFEDVDINIASYRNQTQSFENSTAKEEQIHLLHKTRPTFSFSDVTTEVKMDTGKILMEYPPPYQIRKTSVSPYPTVVMEQYKQTGFNQNPIEVSHSTCFCSSSEERIRVPLPGSVSKHLKWVRLITDYNADAGANERRRNTKKFHKSESGEFLERKGSIHIETSQLFQFELFKCMVQYRVLDMKKPSFMWNTFFATRARAYCQFFVGNCLRHETTESPKGERDTHWFSVIVDRPQDVYHDTKELAWEVFFYVMLEQEDMKNMLVHDGIENVGIGVWGDERMIVFTVMY